MTCHYCGSELKNSERFCHHCGTRQNPVPDVNTPAETPVPEEIQAPAEVSTPEETFPVITPARDFPAPAPTQYKEKAIDWHPYGAPAKEEPLIDFDNAAGRAPKLQLPVKRNLAKMIFLGILTLGIYPIVIWSRLVSEVNIVASRYDGKRTMSFFGMLLLVPFTLGIHSIIWTHKLCNRMGNELRRRGIARSFGAKDFWIWVFLLSTLCSILAGGCAALTALHVETTIIILASAFVSVLSLIGPCIFVAKMMRAINALNKDFNANG